jgi:UDP-N-acetylmuramoyl-L-alanyl-D-glutamate--2,6-diaminopimelate ligase
MMLHVLCSAVADAWIEGDSSVDILAVSHDSRAVTPGTLFVALPGRNTDGTRYIDQALAAGAAAVAVSEDVALTCGVPVVRLPSPRAALALLAAEVHGRPAEELKMIGVTGTNGKTTVSTLVSEICVAGGVGEGLIGTIDHRIAGVNRAAQFTTPEAPALHALLAEMVAADVEIAIMEVSSIGLEERRVDGIPFQVAGFLNLTADHLDYHADMEAYGVAKSTLFTDHLALGGIAIIDIDDAYGQELALRLRAERSDVELWTLSLSQSAASVRFEGLVVNAEGVSGTLITPKGQVSLTSPLLGAFNASNLAMSAALAQAVGISSEAISLALTTAQVRGRLERVETQRGFSVVVDYAHSPDAIERVLETLRPVTTGSLWCVFGCGGDRDVTKRGPMGTAAALADAVVVTSDNPRSEDPAVIAEQAVAGAINAGAPLSAVPMVGATFVELDRRAAIAATLGAAGPGDLILVAGKGHETYQEVGGQRLPFDDVQVVRDLLRVAS